MACLIEITRRHYPRYGSLPGISIGKLHVTWLAMSKQKRDIEECSDMNETHIFRKPENFENFEEKKWLLFWNQQIKKKIIYWAIIIWNTIVFFFFGKHVACPQSCRLESFRSYLKNPKSTFDRVSKVELKFGISSIQWSLYLQGFLLAKIQPTRKCNLTPSN